MLLVDKPVGWTSFDVVNYIRKQVAASENKKPKQVRVGHTGTLDPFASGLLVVLIGKEYTKRAEEFSKLDKTYEVTMLLGKESTTGDPEGEIQDVSTAQPELNEIKTICRNFEGIVLQTPPIYSALKVEGQRAYKLARQGKEVSLEPRKVRINSLEIMGYDYPEVRFKVDVSSGTYIRSLVEDIGKELGTGAYTLVLRRLKVGNFDVSESIKIDNNIIDKIRSF